MSEELEDLFVAALAREMTGEDPVFCGVNQIEVALAAYLARRLWAPRLKLWASGTAHIDPDHDLVTVGRGNADNVIVATRGATFWQARAFDDGVRPPLVFAGGLQVDAHGNANLAGIADDDGRWTLRGPGSAGLPSLTAFARRFYIMVPSHEPRTLVDACSRVSVVGDPKLRAAAGLEPNALTAVLTPLARFEPSPEGLVLTERAPGVTIDEVAGRTGFAVRTADTVAEREPLRPDEARELAVLRAAMERNRCSTR